METRIHEEHRETHHAFPPPPAMRIPATLAPYTPTTDAPWNRQRARHLLRRTGFGAPLAVVDSILLQNPQTIVQQLVEDAATRALPTEPIWAKTVYPASTDPDYTNLLATYKTSARTWLYETQYGWLQEMLVGGLREKLVLFWSNHFVTSYTTYDNNGPYAWQYLSLLRKHALGNFKQFVYDIGKLPAMLYYLNGTSNRKGTPNENYARELLELFTMGIGNYTQADITEIARALTGWRVDNTKLASYLDTTRFDTGNKTFFGQTGSFGYDQVVDIIFAYRGLEIAQNICRKLYKFFVYATPDESVISDMAVTLYQGNFELRPVLQMLFSSKHFFEAAFLGAKIKSPIEMTIGYLLEVGHTAYTTTIYDKIARTYLPKLGQTVLYPPNVAGWPEHRTWISSNGLTARWSFSDILALGDKTTPVPPIKALAEQIPNNENPYDLALGLAEVFLPVRPSDTQRDALGKKLLDGIPDYEWSLSATNSETKLRNYLRYVLRLPEFQLC